MNSEFLDFYFGKWQLPQVLMSINVLLVSHDSLSAFVQLHFHFNMKALSSTDNGKAHGIRNGYGQSVTIS